MNSFSDLYDKVAGGTVGNWLAIVGVLSLIYWGWRIFAAFQHRQEAPPQAAVTPGVQSAPQAEEPNDIAVIAAAVAAVLDSNHRIIHLEPSDSGQTWAIEGRWMQQTSHKPR